MKIISCDVCVLGAGPAGLAISKYFEQNGVDVVCVGKQLYGQLAPIKHDLGLFNPLPMVLTGAGSFPLYDDIGIVDNSKLIVTKHGESKGQRLSMPLPGSFVDFLQHGHGDIVPQVLAVKQFGSVVLERPCEELRKKFENNYNLDGRAKSEKVGHKLGLSPYYYIVKKNLPSQIVNEEINQLNCDGPHLVETENHEIEASCLISTIPLPDFLEYFDDYHHLSFDSASGSFNVFSSKSPLVENSLLYDLDEDSPLYRVFVPHPHFAVAQVVDSSVGGSCTCEYVEQFIESTSSLELMQNIRLENCYPLGVGSVHEKEIILRELEKKNVFTFGRYGQWEYRDLHELKWEKVDAMLEYIRGCQKLFTRKRQAI